MTRILIVGAGFVGLSTARRVARALPKAQVTLIDSKDTFLFTPRLIDALEKPDYPSSNLRADLRAIAKRDSFAFIQGRVTIVDRERRVVTYTIPTSVERTETITYDILALCHGAQPCFYGIPGAVQESIPLKIEADVHHIHEQIRALLQLASQEADREARKTYLSFIGVGAGPSGVEALCSLKLMVEELCREKYQNLLPELSWTLLQAGPQILPGFPPSLVAQTEDLLKKQGIDVRVGEGVTAMQDHVVATAKTTYPAGLVLWTAGIEPNRLTITPEIHTDRAGYLPVNPYLEVSPCVFGAGDVVLYRESNVVIPKNAQTAMLMATTLADNIIRSVRNQPLAYFRYTSKGNVLTVGKTGFLDLRFVVLQTRLVPFIRHLLYRFRFWQVTGM